MTQTREDLRRRRQEVTSLVGWHWSQQWAWVVVSSSWPTDRALNSWHNNTQHSLSVKH